MEDNKRLALAGYLSVTPDELIISPHSYYGLTCYSRGREEYAVGTGEQADNAAIKSCKERLWSFQTRFILAQCGLSMELAVYLERFQADKCEDANPVLAELIKKCMRGGGVREFCRKAIEADGRGHFLSSWDDEECSQVVAGERYFIYRIN